MKFRTVPIDLVILFWITGYSIILLLLLNSLKHEWQSPCPDGLQTKQLHVRVVLHQRKQAFWQKFGFHFEVPKMLAICLLFLSLICLEKIQLALITNGALFDSFSLISFIDHMVLFLIFLSVCFFDFSILFVFIILYLFSLDLSVSFMCISLNFTFLFVIITSLSI